MELEGGNILQLPALVGSAVTSHKTFGPTDLTSTYSVSTRRVFGGIGHRTHSFWSGVRCSNCEDPLGSHFENENGFESKKNQ
ncbi:hypothetical protein TNCV_4604151 [Trichonephila clavipes]|nr:hypothetical protein TNCV_4604151 [Trichonephila clavipes]